MIVTLTSRIPEMIHKTRQTHTRNVCLSDYVHFSAQSNDDLDLGYEIVTRRNLV